MIKFIVELVQTFFGLLALSGVVTASSLLYKRYEHYVVEPNSEDACTTCTFLYGCEAILGAGSVQLVHWVYRFSTDLWHKIYESLYGIKSASIFLTFIGLQHC